MRFVKPSRAIWSIPKVEKNFRSTSYGGRSPNSSASRWGRISLSTKSRMIERTISCSSDHLYMCSKPSASDVRLRRTWASGDDRDGPNGGT